MAQTKRAKSKMAKSKMVTETTWLVGEVIRVCFVTCRVKVQRDVSLSHLCKHMVRTQQNRNVFLMISTMIAPNFVKIKETLYQCLGAIRSTMKPTNHDEA